MARMGYSAFLLSYIILWASVSSNQEPMVEVEDVFFPDALPQITVNGVDCWTHDAFSGKCVHVSQCPGEENRPRHKDICRWEGDQNPIICCPKGNKTEGQNSEGNYDQICGKVEIPGSSQKNRNEEPLAISTNGGTWPWMALIGRVSNRGVTWSCDGVLINTRYVLTAAHCTKRSIPEVVRLGAYNLGVREDSALQYQVERLIVHPDYRHPSMDNDIALIRLDRPVSYKDTAIQPVCLPNTSNKFAGIKTVTAGWGLAGKNTPSNILREVGMTVYDNSDCTNWLKRQDKFASGLSDSQICAGQKCQGDSGSPIMMQNSKDGRIYAIGLSSGCVLNGQLGIYTRITSHVDWIVANAY